MPAKYSGADYIAALAKAVFGLGLAIFMAVIFKSIFFGILTFAFFCFLPIQDEEQEEGTNALMFAVLMVGILFLAFTSSTFFGLGLELGGAAASLGLGTGVLIVLWGVAFIASIPTKLDKWIVSLSELKIFAWGGLLVLSAVLIALLQPWTWNASAIIFFGFWFVCTLGGTGGDLASRHVLGALFVTASILIFSFGIGTQIVGETAFGQFWPQVSQFGQTVFGPIGQIFGSFNATLGQGILLLTNPTGFAQSLMQGNYAVDPSSGLAGAYGVEIEEFRITPVFVNQPYQALVTIKNKGSADAKDIKVALGVPKGAAYTIHDLGFTTPQQDYTGLTKLDVRQAFFPSIISCKSVNDKNLRKTAINLETKLSYTYSVDSALDVSVISTSEWDRLVKAGTLVTQRKKPSTITNSPVKLNIDTLEQPIREGTPFFIGIALTPSQGINITSASLVLEVPKEWSVQTGTQMQICEFADGKSSWSSMAAPYVVYCQFQGIAPTAGAPTQTFLVKANATYTVEKTQSAPLTIQFAGGCCSDADCPKDYTCSGSGDIQSGSCTPKTPAP